MKGWDYEVVAYDCDYYCVECLPEDVDVEDEDVHPIFATDEVDHAPCCCVCGEIHTYMSILEEE